MSAAELIRAAIDRLEQQLTWASSGPWEVQEIDQNRSIVIGGRSRGSIIDGGDFASSEGCVIPPDAALIVTLHRTIDPQLAILRAGIAAHSPGDDTTEEIEVLALDLARAILGEDTE